MIKKCLTIAGSDCSGGALSENGIDKAFTKYMFPIINVITPNIPEAIAANLAKGAEMKEAVRQSKDYVTNAIERSYPVGKRHSPVHHFYELW